MTIDCLRQSLESYSDEELLEIVSKHDTDEWQEAVFSLAEDILRSRGIDLTHSSASAMTTSARQFAAPEEIPSRSLVGRLRTSVLALLVANAVPLFGVLYLGWNAGAIVVFYWTENLIVGLFNVLKMKRAQGPLEATGMSIDGRLMTAADRTSLIVFFIVFYGAFTLGHGFFVLVLFGPGSTVTVQASLKALPFLAVSHGISYWRNFLGQGEYLRVSFARLFMQPFRRVVVMQLTIILGGVWAQSEDSPPYALIVMVVVKTAIDLAGHLAEHRRFLSPR
jgi:hypothetical protein